MSGPTSSLDARLLAKDCVERAVSHIPAMSDLFYKYLFELEPTTQAVFKGSHAFQQRKFANMLLTFRDLKYLERLGPLLKDLGERHRRYHRQFHQFQPSMNQALLKTFQYTLGGSFTPHMADAWQAVYNDVMAIMTSAQPAGTERRRNTADRWRGQERRSSWGSRWDDDLLSGIGGENMVLKVHQSFYDAVFEDPWLGQFFSGKSKPLLVQKQTEFMVSAFGGAHTYRGATPAFVHMHMFISEEVSDLREQYLRRAILSHGLSEDIADRWLAVDRLFRPAIVKHSIEQCVLLTFGQYPVTAVKPPNYQGPVGSQG